MADEKNGKTSTKVQLLTWVEMQFKIELKHTYQQCDMFYSQ